VLSPITEMTTQKVEHYIEESQSHHYASISTDSMAIQKEPQKSSGKPQNSLQEFF